MSGPLCLFSLLARIMIIMDESYSLMTKSRPQNTPKHRTGIIGWGYEGKEFIDLVKDCHDWGVRTVVDVRLTPWSHKPGFTKANLSQWLETEGIKYVHLKALGNPKDNRSGFTSSSIEARNASRRIYEQAMDNEESQAELRYLKDLSSHEYVLLLCFEKDESHCHRAVIKSLVRNEK